MNKKLTQGRTKIRTDLLFIKHIMLIKKNVIGTEGISCIKGGTYSVQRKKKGVSSFVIFGSGSHLEKLS